MSRSLSAEHVEAASRRVQRVYGFQARFYDGFFDWVFGPGRRRAVARLAVVPGEKVLEVGVGTGLSLPQYPEGCEVVGIDISNAMLERARRRLGALPGRSVRLLKMDARAIAFPDGYFDKVLAPYVVSVAPHPEQVLAEMVRICRPGGTIVVVNHFGSRSKVISRLERWATPWSSWIGFRLDQPIETVTTTPGTVLVGEERVNLLGLWRLLELKRL